MVNEEVVKEAMQAAKEGITYAIKIAKVEHSLEKAIKKQMKIYLAKANKGIYKTVNGNKVRLKDFYKKGQLEDINLENKADLKALKKELNRNGVNFSVMKDRANGGYTVFFQANGRKVLNQAFKNVLADKERKKPSTIKKLDECRDKVAKDIAKEKTKEKVKAASKSMAMERGLL